MKKAANTVLDFIAKHSNWFKSLNALVIFAWGVLALLGDTDYVKFSDDKNTPGENLTAWLFIIGIPALLLSLLIHFSERKKENDSSIEIQTLKNDIELLKEERDQAAKLAEDKEKGHDSAIGQIKKLKEEQDEYKYLLQEKDTVIVKAINATIMYFYKSIKGGFTERITYYHVNDKGEYQPIIRQSKSEEYRKIGRESIPNGKSLMAVAAKRGDLFISKLPNCKVGSPTKEYLKRINKYDKKCDMEELKGLTMLPASIAILPLRSSDNDTKTVGFVVIESDSESFILDYKETIDILFSSSEYMLTLHMDRDDIYEATSSLREIS